MTDICIMTHNCCCNEGTPEVKGTTYTAGREIEITSDNVINNKYNINNYLATGVRGEFAGEIGEDGQLIKASGLVGIPRQDGLLNIGIDWDFFTLPDKHEYKALVTRVNSGGVSGKSAYQIWLDAGNTGTEADFLTSLKGEKGDKGDVTDIGTNAVTRTIIPLTNSQVPPNSDNTEYHTLSWNSKTELGFLHLDIRPTVNIGRSVIIGQIPTGVPKPVTLIEQNVVGSDADGTGQIYITTSGQISVNNLIQGRRYIVDLTGYYR